MVKIKLTRLQYDILNYYKIYKDRFNEKNYETKSFWKYGSILY